jgi:dihydrofolate reductase
MPIIALVVATAKDRVIGKDGHLPWRKQRSDRRFFRKVTLGKPVIMGRRTHNSIGRVLDKRTNIVLTRNRGYIVPGAVIAHSLEEALTEATRVAENDGVDEISVIGGEEVFREVLPRASRIYLTEVHAELPGDRWFAELDVKEWRERSRDDHPSGPEDEYPFSLVLLERM